MSVNCIAKWFTPQFRSAASKSNRVTSITKGSEIVSQIKTFAKAKQIWP